MACCVYTLCYLEHLFATRHGTAMQHTTRQVLEVELADPRQPLRNWCLRALGLTIAAEDGEETWVEQVIDWLERELVRDDEERMIDTVQWMSLWLNDVSVLMEQGGSAAMLGKDRFALLLSFVDFVGLRVQWSWVGMEPLFKPSPSSDLHPNLLPSLRGPSHFLNSCHVHLHSSLFHAVSPRPSTLYSFSLSFTLVTALITLKKVVDSSPRFLFGTAAEVVIPFPELLTTTLECYQLCLLCRYALLLTCSSDDSLAINACAELYISIITARVQADRNDLTALWGLVCMTTTAVMGDAPLAVLKEEKELVVSMEGEEEGDSAVLESRTAPKEQEWTWQV